MQGRVKPRKEKGEGNTLASRMEQEGKFDPVSGRASNLRFCPNVRRRTFVFQRLCL